jgi:hypothetical protein
MATIEEGTPTHGFAAYRRVLTSPRVAAIAAASVAAGLPRGMGAVALVLYVLEAGCTAAPNAFIWWNGAGRGGDANRTARL